MKKPPRPPDPEWDPVHRSNYETRLFDTRAWLRKSEELFAAAELNEPKIAEHWEAQREYVKSRELRIGDRRHRDDVIGIYFMLVAYAVENLLKAALIERSQPRRGALIFRQLSKLHQEFTRTGKLPLAIKGHDLFLLATQAGISCTPEEEGLLRRLTRASEWYGRYPVPVESAGMNGSKFFSDGKEYSIAYSSDEDVARVGRLWNKLRNDLLVDSQAAKKEVSAGDDTGESAAGGGDE